MTVELDIEMLRTIGVFAGGVGAVGAALVSGVVLSFNGWRNRVQNQRFRDKETELAERRLADDRRHALEMIAAQKDAQIAQAAYEVGRDIARELLDDAAVLEDTWMHDDREDLYKIDRNLNVQAIQRSFQLPDARASEFVGNGFRYIGNAWVLSRLNGSGTAAAQRAELSRIRGVLRDYIAGTSLAQDELDAQRDRARQLSEAFEEMYGDET